MGNHENGENEHAGAAWHLDRRVPIVLIAAIMLQTGTAIWWAANQEAMTRQNSHDITLMRHDLSKEKDLTSRVVRIETLLQSMQTTLAEIRGDLRENSRQ